MNTLPMMDPDDFPSGDSEAFATREELLVYLARCLEEVDPPIQHGFDVRSVTQMPSGTWEVDAGATVFETAAVAICTGAMSAPRLPGAHTQVPTEVPQLHSSEYRNPEQIATRRVLVVGSASSGVQICRLLGESGMFEEISMSVSRVLTLPDRILGVQTHRFFHRLGLFDVRTDSLLGKLMYSGLETKGDPIMRPAPKDLARLFGVGLVGRFSGVSDRALQFADGSTLDAEDLTIIWCTGFQGDYAFIQVEEPGQAFGPTGMPIHARGVVSAAPGLFFVGLRYQHTVASHDIYGVGSDAAFVADQIAERLALRSGDSPVAQSRSSRG